MYAVLLLFEARLLIMVSPLDALTVVLFLFPPGSGRGVHADDTLLPATAPIPVIISVLGKLTRAQCLIIDIGGLTYNEQAVFGIPTSIIETVFRIFLNIDAITTLWPEPRIFDGLLSALL